MRYLVIYAHPNPGSFNHALLETVTDTLTKEGRTAVVRDLYALGFDPLLGAADFDAIGRGEMLPDAKREQEYISAAHVLIFIYPLWWAGMPAMLKGYIDRVFTDGFAYRIDGEEISGLLGDKKVLLITTTGAPRDMYEASGMFRSLAQTIDDGIFRFCGMDVIDHRYLTAVPYVTGRERAAMLAEVSACIQRLPD